MKCIYIFILLFTFASPVLGQTKEIAEIKSHIAEDNFSDALSLIEDALKSHPNNFYLRTGEARVNLWMNNWDKGQTLIQSLLDTYPGNKEVQDLHLKCLEWSGQWNELRHHAQQYYQLDQDNSAYLKAYALALIHLHEFQKARLYDLKKMQLETLYLQEQQNTYQLELESSLYTFKNMLSPWYVSSVRLKRNGKLPFLLQTNHANRFTLHGIQVGASIFPKLGKTLSAEFEFNYSQSSIFPTVTLSGSAYKTISKFSLGGGATVRKFSNNSSVSPFTALYFYTKNSVSKIRSEVNIIGKNRAYGIAGSYSYTVNTKHILLGNLAYGNYLDFITISDIPSSITYQHLRLSYTYRALNGLATTAALGTMKEYNSEAWSRNAIVINFKLVIPLKA